MIGLIFRLALFAATITAWLSAGRLLVALGIDPATSEGVLGRDLLHALAWVTGAFVATGALDVFLWRGFVARMVRRPVPGLLRGAVALIVMIIAAAGIVGVVFERDVTGIWATSGVVGIVLGFALRNMIQDVFTGIALNLDGSIKIGDRIKLHHRDFVAEQHYGEVIDINWRTSRIRLDNNNIVVVPNSLMGMMAVTNFGQADYKSRFDVEVVLDFAVPAVRASEVMIAGAKAAAAEDFILADPPPHVIVDGPTERGVSYLVRFWGHVSRYTPVIMQDAVMRKVLQHLRFAGLVPAYPKEDVFHERMPKRVFEPRTREDRVALLSGLDLFRTTLSREDLEVLADRIETVAVAEGEALVRQGENATSLFVIAEGLLDVLVGEGADGRPTCVGHVGAGQLIGEMSLLTGEPRSATVVAATPALAYEIDQEQFGAVLSRRPEIAEAISALVAERRLRTDEALRNAAAATVERERRRVQHQILDRMRSVFVFVLDSSSVRRKDNAAP